MQTLSTKDVRGLVELAEALQAHDGALQVRSISTLERLTNIKDWGAMAGQSGVGLGYARLALDGSGAGEPRLSVERYEQITRAIEAQPFHYRLALLCVYENGRSISALARGLGVPRRRVEGWVWHALERVDALVN
ncbi:MAG: hypothetical protein LBE21_10125 [Pseudomonadales bacterium]|jgi:hypothetical protein|nr:hypothetical protein [Pseudomonadales bacterium]